MAKLVLSAVNDNSFEHRFPENEKIDFFKLMCLIVPHAGNIINRR